MKPKYISLEAAAKYLGMSRRTLYRMMHDGQLPMWKKIRGRSVIELEAVETFNAEVIEK